ncbi:MAG TPA: ATP-dependent zinc metalloprotease FtsH [Anaeromyxobacteraceae bacterium]|nr:ATP-dependent zinc metalloprotease FtsH [Anaeromyxobacteraceae bacterium]
MADGNKARRLVWWAILGAWVMTLLWATVGTGPRPESLSYSDFKAALAQDKVAEVRLSATEVRGRMKPEAAEGQGRSFEVVRVEDPDLVRELMKAGVRISGVQDRTPWWSALLWLLPAAAMAAVLVASMRRAGQAGQGFMTVGRSKAKVYVETDVKVTFEDVAGVDEAKEELHEVIDFLKTPERFRRLGGRIPKGVLLVGPPGTGKTLLARAVAGEAGVPFFSISGSEFVEMFVGVGAARVRDLFTQAKQRAPCIIFIDELDALGKMRGVGPMAHEEREQTLNQLLVEMDGFDTQVGVIIMAATNRPEILDPALLRAGRFDRHVLVDRPDKAGRLAILQVHAREVKLARGEDLEVIASMTAGLVGADLANVVNEAALLAVRRDREKVELSELQEAVERIVAGLEKRNRVLNRMEKERVAHHEIGHALVALALPGQDQVQKISIIPRGIAALGYTLQLPTEDRFLMTEAELESKIAVLLGGRSAEEMVYGDVSTGAQDDLLKATDIARSMVRAYGMSEKLGPLSFERDGRPLFLRTGEPPARPDVSEEVLRQIDQEVRRIVEAQHARARRILIEREELLRAAAAELLQRETLSGEELLALAARHPTGHGAERSEAAPQHH